MVSSGNFRFASGISFFKVSSLSCHKTNKNWFI
jgi:hypothetical protein